jgi:hypothetical protein
MECFLHFTRVDIEHRRPDSAIFCSFLRVNSSLFWVTHGQWGSSLSVGFISLTAFARNLMDVYDLRLGNWECTAKDEDIRANDDQGY